MGSASAFSAAIRLLKVAFGSLAEDSARRGTPQLHLHLRKKLGATCTAAKCHQRTFVPRGASPSTVL